MSFFTPIEFATEARPVYLDFTLLGDAWVALQPSLHRFQSPRGFPSIPETLELLWAIEEPLVCLWSFYRLCTLLIFLFIPYLVRIYDCVNDVWFT